jgi:hypothetical protein
MLRSQFAFPLLIALGACDSIHPLVYNETPCSITVVYSAANIHNHAAVVAPGEYVATIGIVGPRLRSARIVDDAGATHDYPEAALPALRPADSGRDRWGYFPDGLHFLTQDPAHQDVSIPSQCHHQPEAKGRP